MFGLKNIYLQTWPPVEIWAMILEHAIYDVYNYLIQRKSIKKRWSAIWCSLSLNIFFLVYRKTDWQIWQTIMPPIIPSGMFIKIKLTIMGLFLKILSKNVSLIVLLLMSHLLDRSFSNMLSLLNPRTQLQYSF